MNIIIKSGILTEGAVTKCRVYKMLISKLDKRSKYDKNDYFSRIGMWQLESRKVMDMIRVLQQLVTRKMADLFNVFEWLDFLKYQVVITYYLYSSDKTNTNQSEIFKLFFEIFSIFRVVKIWKKIFLCILTPSFLWYEYFGSVLVKAGWSGNIIILLP